MPGTALLSLSEMERIQAEVEEVIRLYRQNTKPEEHLELLLRMQNLLFALKEFELSC